MSLELETLLEPETLHEVGISLEMTMTPEMSTTLAIQLLREVAVEVRCFEVISSVKALLVQSPIVAQLAQTRKIP